MREEETPREETPREEAAREEEFLRRSLDDLDRELAAGDLSADYHRRLYRAYAARLEGVLNKPDASEGGGSGGDLDAGGRVGGGRGGRGRGIGDSRRVRSPGWRRPLVVVLVAAMLAAAAGAALASSVGFRTSGDTPSGDIRESTRGRLFAARELMAAAREAQAEGSAEESLRLYDEAVAVYHSVLDAEPSNAEALAWRGWLEFLRGDLQAAAEWMRQAVAADDDYPDARVFAAVVAARQSRFADAAEHLRAFDASPSPPEMTALVNGTNLRESIESGLSWELADRLTEALPDDDDWGDFDALVSASDSHSAALAGRLMDFEGHAVAAARIYQWVLLSDPNNPIALMGRGVRLTSPDFLAFPELFDDGVKALERLAELAPDDPEARYWLALALYRAGRFADALASLDALENLEPPENVRAAAVRLREEMLVAGVSGE